MFLVAAEELLAPWLAFGSVEDHQVPFGGAASVHVFTRLFETVADRAVQVPVQHLALDDHFLVLRRRALPRPGLCVLPLGRPQQQEVRPHPAKAVLALNPSATVNNALEKCLQQQLRSGFLVLETLHPVLRVLAEELLERGQQVVDP
ncbi:MAG: hypothetical protein OXG82_05070 [Gammaproteobacteria bacterium]|nr:hypothetical protein [Gammaproteobacteria bacterium]